jgi:hypothetical protein
VFASAVWAHCVLFLWEFKVRANVGDAVPSVPLSLRSTCHSERSEESIFYVKILHFAQNDNASHFRSHVLAPKFPPQAATGCPASTTHAKLSPP